jgi:hypothetical protein
MFSEMIPTSSKVTDAAVIELRTFKNMRTGHSTMRAANRATPPMR